MLIWKEQERMIHVYMYWYKYMYMYTDTCTCINTCTCCYYMCMIQWDPLCIKDTLGPAIVERLSPLQELTILWENEVFPFLLCLGPLLEAID